MALSFSSYKNHKSYSVNHKQPRKEVLLNHQTLLTNPHFSKLAKSRNGNKVTAFGNFKIWIQLHIFFVNIFQFKSTVTIKNRGTCQVFETPLCNIHMFILG